MPPGIGYGDDAMNAAALEEVLGGGMGGMDGAMPPGPGLNECPLCTGPVDPETGMTLAPPAMPMDTMGAPPGMPGMPGGGMPPMV